MARAELIASLTKNEKRYLARRECAWCNMPLNRKSCGAIYEKCSEASRIVRLISCLEEYKPRVDKVDP